MADGETSNEPRTEGVHPQTDDNGSSANSSKSASNTNSKSPEQKEMLYNLLGSFSKIAGNGTEGVSPQVTDALTQAMLAILGAGPSMAAFDSLMSAQAANGMMYYNAVANQQKANMLGMAMTAKCVRYMMDPALKSNMDDWGDDDD